MQVEPLETLLLTGFLGAGKTTLIAGWLAARPPHERWAVLVNEFGALGIDAALLARPGDGGAVEVAEIAGGCACCAARTAFTATLVRLLRRGPWHRLIVEATGLGHPAQLVDALRDPAIGARLRVLPPVAVVDADRAALYDDPARPGHAVALDQVALARVLVLNRARPEDAAETAALAGRLAGLPPWPRAVIPTADGRVPLDDVLAALAADTDPGMMRRSLRPPAALAGVHDAGWRWPAERLWDRARLQAALLSLAGDGGTLRACGLLRAKGVFRTSRAWYGWQWVDGRVDWQESAWRSDSRLEVLALRPIDPQMVDNALRAAVSAG